MERLTLRGYYARNARRPRYGCMEVLVTRWESTGLAEIPIDELTVDCLLDARDAFKHSPAKPGSVAGRPVTRHTLAKYLQWLKRILLDACGDGLLPRLDADAICEALAPPGEINPARRKYLQSFDWSLQPREKFA